MLIESYNQEVLLLRLKMGESYLAFSIALEDETSFSSNAVTFFLRLASLSSAAKASRV